MSTESIPEELGSQDDDDHPSGALPASATPQQSAVADGPAIEVVAAADGAAHYNRGRAQDADREKSNLALPDGRNPSWGGRDGPGGVGSVGVGVGGDPASPAAAAAASSSASHRSRSLDLGPDSAGKLRGSLNKAVLGAAARQAALGRSKPQHTRSATYPSATAARQRRPSYAINDLKIDSSSQWGEGVAVIESVLEPGSATEASLTAEQRLGLRNVQFLLLRHGSDGKEGLRAHVPRALLGSLRERGSYEEEGDSGDDMDSDEEESSRYLLSHFGGVTNSKKSTEETKRKIKNVVMAHSFMTSLMGNSSLNKMRDEVFLPPEWEALSMESRVKIRNMLSWESLKRWDFNVLELAELSGGHPLLMVGWAVLGSPMSLQHMSESCGDYRPPDSKPPGYRYADEFSYSMETLCGFLRAMESEYDADNPYHNNIHAADVLQTVHSLMQLGGKEFAQADIQSFSILLAAVVHDVGHPGENNAYQINSKSHLAIRYNDISVLENMHASKAFQLIMGEKHDPKINILGQLRPAQTQSVRKIVIDAILHTDMTKHFTMVDQMKGLLVSKDVESEIKKEHSLEVLNYMLHLADISNPAKPAPMFLEWTDRCLEEFFSQGDMEKKMGLPVSPLCDREKTSRKQSQIGFIQYVVEPAYEVMAKALPALEEEVMVTIGDNLNYWRRLPEKRNCRATEEKNNKAAEAAPGTQSGAERKEAEEKEEGRERAENGTRDGDEDDKSEPSLEEEETERQESVKGGGAAEETSENGEKAKDNEEDAGEKEVGQRQEGDAECGNRTEKEEPSEENGSS